MNSLDPSNFVEPLIFKDGVSIEIWQDSRIVGVKAAGLARFPVSWMPRFAVIPSSFFQRVISLDPSDSDYETCAGKIEEILVELGVGGADQVIVRSNGLSETLEDRGKYISSSTLADARSVIEGLHVVASSCPGEEMAAIIQIAIAPASPGHLSNERRFSQSSDQFRAEAPEFENPQDQNRTIKISSTYSEGPLVAKTEKDAIARLREVAGYIHSLVENRIHIEWVWDAKFLWVVQCDDEILLHENPKVRAYLQKASSYRATVVAGEIVSGMSSIGSQGFIKLDCPRTFKELKMPVSEIGVVEGSTWAGLNAAQRLEACNEILSSQSSELVVRTDLTRDSSHEYLLLPTSLPISRPEELVEFFENTECNFDEAGLRKEGWAFLLAPLVPARASAMVEAKPGDPIARVDANWGFPDGLLFGAHDTYFYSRNTRKIAHHPHFKESAYFALDSKWETYDVPPNLDWARVLNDSEIQTVSEWAWRLADHLGVKVQLMVLCRIGGRRGGASCLPWHYTKLDPDESETVYTGWIPDSSKLLVISEPSEIPLDADFQSGPKIEGVRLRPKGSVLRSSEFLKQVGEFAARNLIPIYFEGSQLGHAYYLMKRAGARLIVAGSPRAPRLEVRHDKIVRDSIPMIIQQAGGLARVRRVSLTLGRKLLLKKMIEEIVELAQAEEEQDIIEELADVREVMDALLEAFEIDPAELDRVQREKREKRGGFSKLVFLESAELARSAESDREGELPLEIEDESNDAAGAVDTERVSVTFGDDQAIEISVPFVPTSGTLNDTFGFVFGHRTWSLTTEVRAGSVNLRLSADSMGEIEQLDLFEAE